MKSLSHFNPMQKFLLTIVAFILLAFTSLAQKTATIVLNWDPIPEAGAKYRIYWGATSRGYTNLLDSGPLLTNSITGLVDGARYYFAVTAYNTNGLESDYSNEYTTVLSSRPPAPGAPRGYQQRDVVYHIDLRGKTNSNGTVTPIGDVIIAEDIEGPVSVTANVLTNGVVMNSRTVTTSTGLASITGNKAIPRPFTGAIDVTKVSYDPNVREEAEYR